MEPKPIWTKLWSIRHLLLCWLTPFVWSPLLAVVGRQKEARCGYVVAVMITYWFTEVIPMAITSLIPVVLFPVLQIMSTDKVAKSYFNVMMLCVCVCVCFCVELMECLIVIRAQ